MYKLLGKNQRIMSLRNPLQKMSKSDNQEMTRIDLTDTPDVIHNKIRKAVTDCTSAVTYEPENRPGVSNLVSIYSALSEKSTDEVVQEFIGKETVELKDSLSELIISHLKPIQERIKELEEDEGHIEQILTNGAARARERAEETIREVKCLLGVD